jgi:DNA excision repair protein ERCC-4
MSFARWPEATVERGTLATGDYSIKGFESVIAVERKELNDLIGCLMGAGRDRFERELARGAALPHFFVAIEASMEDVAKHRYLSHMEPHAVFSSILAFTLRWHTNFMFCTSRAGAEYATFNLLRLFLREIETSYLAATKAVQGLKQPTKRKETP